MAQLKAQLEAAGFDTAGFDEADLIAKLDQAGFDTSSLGGTPKTGLEKAVDVSNKVTDTLSAPLRPLTERLGKAMSAVHGASQAAAEKEAEMAGKAGVLPISAMVPAVPAMLIEALGVPQKAGEFVAEKAGEKGFPTLGAAVGTGVAMAPELAGGAAALAKRGLIGEGLKEAGRTAMAPVRAVKKFATAPNATEAAQIGKEALSEVAERGGQKLSLAKEVKETAKKGLIETEEKAGLHFQSTPEFEALIADPKRMSKFTETVGRLSKKSPTELSQALAPRELQNIRKVLQEGEKVSGLSDIAKAQMRDAKDVFTRALGEAKPEVGKALQNFRDADRVLGEIPRQTRAKYDAQKLKNAKDLTDAKSLDRKRRVVRGLAKTVGYYFLGKSLLK